MSYANVQACADEYPVARVCVRCWTCQRVAMMCG